MSKTIRLLSLLLLVQLLLVIGFWWSSTSYESSAPPTDLVDIETQGLNRIEIADPEKRLLLEKSASGWLLPEYGSLAVTDTKIEELLDQLNGLKGGWPVATSESAAARFEVSEENAQRTVKLFKSSENLATLRFGSSPAFRQIHMRVGDQPEVYSVAFALHDVPVEADAWFDSSLLKFSSEIDSVTTEGFTLVKQDAEWTLSPAVEGGLDADAINSWVERFTSLRVAELVPSEKAQLLEAGQPLMTATIKSADQEINYRIFKEEDTTYIKSSLHPRFFEIAGYQANPLLDISLESFVKTEAEGDDEEENKSAALPPDAPTQ